MNAPVLIIETYDAASLTVYPPIPREALEVERHGKPYSVATTRWNWPTIVYELRLLVPAVKL